MIPEAPCGLAALIRRIAGLDQRKSSLARMVTAVFIFGSLMGPLVDRAASGQDSNAADKKAATGEHSDDAAKKPDAPAQLALDLSDGSRIIGAPSIDRLKLTTTYASLDLQLSQVSSVEFSGTNHAAQVKLRNGDILNGQLAGTDIEMKTLFGQATIPLAQVRRIRMGRIGGVLPEGLVLHYTFDENEGAKVTDASGNGNDGAVQGATYTSEGKMGGAMSFNGDSQGVIAKNSASLQLQDFTIMAWIKRGDKTRVTQHGINEGGVVFAYGQGGYGLVFNRDGQLALTKVGIDNVPATFRVQDDTWHHLAVTKKGTKVVFYLDGTAFQAADYDVNFEFVTDAGTGARGDTVDNSFIGLIDEVMVFKRALSDDEVKEIYDSQK